MGKGHKWKHSNVQDLANMRGLSEKDIKKIIKQSGGRYAHYYTCKYCGTTRVKYTNSPKKPWFAPKSKDECPARK